MAIIDDLKAKFDARILADGTPCGDATVRVAPADLPEVARFLKGERGFTMFVDLLGVHWPQRAEELDVVVHVRNPETMEFVRLKAATAKECPSLTGVWAGADWCEREAYDLFGIVFTGHPDLKRIYMPDDYPLHPMRKEHPLEGTAANATYDGDFSTFPQPGTQGDTTRTRNLG